MKITLLGPPGAGKGTVSEELIKNFDLYHLSVGALLREEVAKNTPLGKDIKKFMEKGDLVPNQFVVETVKLDILNKEKFILDGFPRSLEQAKSIEDINLDLAIYLEVPLDIVIERLSGRRMCTKCNRIFHIKYIPPKDEHVCDDCGGKLIQRKDDAPEAVKERFRVYQESTAPLVEFYENKGILVKVDASKSPEIVKAATVQVVKDKFGL